MALFENERKANLDSSIAMIEQALGQLGHDAAAARQSGDELAWTFAHGSATVTVSLVQRDDYTHLRVVAPVMTTDARVDVLALYRHLLSLHAGDVHGAAFATVQDQIQLVSERSTIDLDRSEVLDIIKRVRDYADDYDDKLVAEFGGRLAGDGG